MIMGWNNNRYYYYNRYDKYDRKTARLSSLVCSLMFIIFASVYLAVFQKELLEAIHLSMSKGNTTFKIVPATIIILVILMILKWGLNLLMRLKGKAHALAYIPSFMGLVTMTGFGRDVYMGEFYHAWWWLMLVLTAVFVTLVTVTNKFRTASMEKPDALSTVIWNVSLMTLMSIATVCLGNSDRYFHNELRMESLMAKGNNAEAMRVAEKSLRTTKTMTALRMMAMTKEDKTGEVVFRYPQYYKVEGMFFDSDSTKTLRFTNDSIFCMLGEKPQYGEKRMDYLKRMAAQEDSCRYARTYYLTGLMLDKDLEGFAKALTEYGTGSDSLQRYFKEAAIMYKGMNPKWDYEIADKDSAFHKARLMYLERKKESYKSEDEERNTMRRDFGDTFWWYYDYQE